MTEFSHMGGGLALKSFLLNKWLGILLEEIKEFLRMLTNFPVRLQELALFDFNNTLFSNLNSCLLRIFVKI